MAYPEIINFKIHEDENSDDFIPGFLKDYWMFEILSDENNNYLKIVYKHTIKELSKKYNIAYSKVPSIIKKQGISTYTAVLGCEKCKSEVSVNERKDLILEFDINSPRVRGFCESCFKSTSESIANNILNKIHSLSDSGKISNVNISTAELSYIEILILLCILTSKYLDPLKISQQDWLNFTAIEINKSSHIIDRLISKNILPRSIKFEAINEILEEVRKLYVSDRFSFLPQALIYKIKSEVEKLNSASINLPSNFKTINEFSSHLFQELINRDITLNDIKDIEDFVLAKRISEIENIFSTVCKENKIPYKMDNSLLVLFKRMSENFDLLICNNLINYKAQQTVFEINKTNRFATPHLFRNILDKYISYLNENKDSKRYKRNLPYNWMYSEIEAFIKLHVMDDSSPWESQTTSEIIRKWLISLDIAT